MTPSTADAIFAQLKAGVPDKRKATLDRLKAACDDLHPHGRFRLQDIERRITDRFGKEFGPRAQTISNEKNLPLGMYHYVAARRREAEQGIRARSGRSAAGANIAQRIDALEDFDLRNSMRDVYDRMLTAEATAARAKHLLKVTRPGVDVDAMIAGTGAASASLVDEKSTAALRMMRAVLTNEEKLSSCGLMIESGHIRRKGRTGDQLLSAALMKDFLDFCTALDRL